MVNTILPQKTNKEVKQAVITELATQIVTLQESAAEKIPPAPVQITPEIAEERTTILKETLATEMQTVKQAATQTIEGQPKVTLSEDEIYEKTARNVA